ncbi:hypothetical protein AB0Q95_05210 [Streptomyces sp. NPDC059900]|uniref:hypothetical protein n=1 Tax=Streptomyces sp. NPDC059900 TaxID=3155816 RepID=UPI0034225C21
MPENINWSFSVNVAEGPSLTGSSSLKVNAYDKLSVPISAGTTALDVQVQPANAAGKVQLLVIRASPTGRGITFSADAGGTTFTLEGPVVLIGPGAVRLLADAPQTLRLANATAADAMVDIFIGRDPAA